MWKSNRKNFFDLRRLNFHLALRYVSSWEKSFDQERSLIVERKETIFIDLSSRFLFSLKSSRQFAPISIFIDSELCQVRWFITFLFFYFFFRSKWSVDHFEVKDLRKIFIRFMLTVENGLNFHWLNRRTFCSVTMKCIDVLEIIKPSWWWIFERITRLVFLMQTRWRWMDGSFLFHRIYLFSSSSCYRLLITIESSYYFFSDK